MRLNPFPEPELHLIKDLYESTVTELMDQMREGKPWEEMTELRASLSQLSAILYDRVQAATIPASLSSVA